MPSLGNGDGLRSSLLQKLKKMMQQVSISFPKTQGIFWNSVWPFKSLPNVGLLRLSCKKLTHYCGHTAWNLWICMGLQSSVQIIISPSRLHTADSIRDFGPFQEFWTFLFERLNKVLKSYKSNNHGHGELETSFFREYHRTKFKRVDCLRQRLHQMTSTFVWSLVHCDKAQLMIAVLCRCSLSRIKIQFKLLRKSLIMYKTLLA